MKTEAILLVISVIIVISISLGFALGHVFPVTQTITRNEISNQTITVTYSNPDYTTQTMDCSGVPVCGLSSAYIYTNSITTIADNHTRQIAEELLLSTSVFHQGS